MFDTLCRHVLEEKYEQKKEVTLLGLGGHHTTPYDAYAKRPESHFVLEVHWKCMWVHFFNYYTF